MIVPTRDIGNKFVSTSAFTTSVSNMTQPSEMDMVVNNCVLFFQDNCENYDEVRGCTMISNIQGSRTLLLSSSKCLKDYHTRVQQESDKMVENEPNVLSDSPQLEYITPKSQNNKVSGVTDMTCNLRQQCVTSDTLAFNTFVDSNNNVFNMQLQYNINQALNPEFWDGNFHAILLHGSMEHLASDMKNIKKSLRRM